ncbi:MAG: CbiX/SirB N-terminal domain-containing protein [Gammaproteobacteria bacterium]|nr:CbiX/SirB N-terminal domain-containing protein [Gammaproteobacteria bacterium]
MNDQTSRALLVVAHGSRRSASNEEIRRLAERLQSSQSHDFAMIEAAYLELAEPSIPDAIEGCIRKGAIEVVVFPYFLSAGRHVAEDIPEAVKIKQQQHPSITITIADYLGTAVNMPRMILEHLRLDTSSDRQEGSLS